MTEANKITGETVPVEALTALQTQLEATAEAATQKDAELAALRAQVEASDALVAAAKEKTAALETLNKALEAKKAAAEAAAEAAAAGANFSRSSTKARFRITIDGARDKNEPDPVFVAVNGRGYYIKRNQMVDVPQEVVSVLNDAVTGRAEPEIDERTGNAAGVRYVPARRIPFQLHGQSRDKAGEYIAPYTPLDYEAVTKLV